MKLCPYPFSRMQTKNDQVHTENKGGFFPCCPSWFNQSYWDFGLEKNLDDIWNGKQAQELRKRMYEGDYSFCNRGECKIPLMTIEEMADPNINFIETPISKENLEAVKNKNPVMPEQPSSLHLVADTRCNLKCPTCRPEIISNTVESIEADEEYELVHRLKKDVEIIKMSSSGEVFYSQTQRKLLKSLTPEDFPKLRRVHIVSNGTLFNQKAYNDLLPGTSYIKDVSISMDAGSKEVYEKLRGPYWEQVVSNLEWLGKMRKAGKFELFTLNCTLIRDNYRDIPNLVELGRKNNVDRILIQKYNFADNQGFKTFKDQEDQAIHLPTHPEHIHMIRTLEMFKHDPLVHTLLDIKGFEDKIDQKIRLRKALSEIQKLSVSLENGLASGAMTFNSELFEMSLIAPEHLEKIQQKVEKMIVNDESLIELDSDFLKEENIDIREGIISVFRSAVYHLHKDAKYSDALKSFIVLSSLTKDQPADIYAVVASSLKELGRLDEANIYREKALEKKLKEFSDNALDLSREELYDSNMQLGYLLKQHGHSLKAISHFKFAMEQEPESKKGLAAKQLYYMYSELGFSSSQNDKKTEATEYFQEALKVAPLSEVAMLKEQLYYVYRELGFLKKQNSDMEMAIFYFKAALNTGHLDQEGLVSEQLYYIYREQGFSLQKKEKYKEAVEVLMTALEFGSGDEYIFFSLGISFKRQKNYPEAIKSFNQALGINPNHYYSIMELGVIELLEGRRDKAEEFFLKAQKNEPEDKKSYGKKMLMLAQRKKKSL